MRTISNEIEIRVTSKDQTGAGFASADARVKALEASSGSTLGRIKDKFAKSGQESGEAFSSETLKGLEKGLAGAESKLASAKARLAKALDIGGGEISNKQRASIEYDIKIHEESVRDFSSKLKAEGERAGKLLAEGTGKEVEGGFKRLASKFTKIGGDVGQGMATSAVKGFSSIGGLLTDNPVLAAVSGALILGLTPLIVTGLGAAIGLALGAGIIGAGIMAAVKTDPSIATAFDGLEARAAKSMRGFGKSFAEPVKEGIGILDQSLARIDPAIQRIGAKMAPLVSGIASGIGGLVERMMPGIERLADAMRPMFDQLKEDLPQVGAALGSLFDSIAKAGPGEIAFFHDFINILDGTVVGMGKVIEAGSGVYDAMDKFGNKINDAISPTEDAAKATETLGSAQSGMANAAKTAADAIQGLYNKLVDTGMATLSERAAFRQWEAAIDDVTVAVKKNGKSLDVNTSAGRSNQETLDNVANTGLHVVQSLNSQHAAQDRVSGATQAGIGALIKAGRQYGMTSADAVRYAQSIFSIPATKATLIQALGAKAAAALVHDLAGAINSLHGKTVTVATNFVNRGALGYGAGGVPIGNAAGGIVGAATGGNHGGLRWVGEAGPELVRLPPGSSVSTTGDSRRLAMAGAGARGGDTYNVTINTGADPNEVARALKQFARDNHGLALKGGVRAI